MPSSKYPSGPFIYKNFIYWKFLIILVFTCACLEYYSFWCTSFARVTGATTATSLTTNTTCCINTKVKFLSKFIYLYLRNVGFP